MQFHQCKILSTHTRHRGQIADPHVRRVQIGKLFRIRSVVALEAVLFIIVLFEADVLKADMSRILQGVIAEIGFPGADEAVAESPVKI